MAVYDGTIKYQDDQGDLNILYPTTKWSNLIDGADENGKIPLERLPKNVMLRDRKTLYIATDNALDHEKSFSDYSVKAPFDENGASVCAQIQAVIDQNASEDSVTVLKFIGELSVDIPYSATFTQIPKIIIKSGIVLEGDFQFVGNHIYSSSQHLFDFKDGAKNCGIQNSTLCETVSDTVYSNYGMLAGGTEGSLLSNVFLKNLRYINPRNSRGIGQDDARVCFTLSGDGIEISNCSFETNRVEFRYTECSIQVSGMNVRIENNRFGELTVEIDADLSLISNCSIDSTGSYSPLFLVEGSQNYLENIKISGRSSSYNLVSIGSGNKVTGVTLTTGNIVKSFDSGANSVAIEDAGNYFTGTDMEGALQEAGASLSNKASKTIEGWSTITLQNNWAAFDAARTPKYRKDNFGRVSIKGAIKNGTSGQIAFCLPPGYRPLQMCHFSLTANIANITACCNIDTNGNVTVTSTNTTLIGLDSISFYID